MQIFYHACWYDNTKTRWMSYILVDLIHDAQELYWRSRKHSTCTRVPSPMDLLCISFPMFSLGCEERKSIPSEKRESQKAKQCISHSRCLIGNAVGSKIPSWWEGSSLNGPIDYSLLTLY